MFSYFSINYIFSPMIIAPRGRGMGGGAWSLWPNDLHLPKCASMDQHQALFSKKNCLIITIMLCSCSVAPLSKLQWIAAFSSSIRLSAVFSTETAVLKVVTDILAALDRGQISLLGMFDLSAAFDTVDHSILLRRLENRFGIRGAALEWFS